MGAIKHGRTTPSNIAINMFTQRPTVTETIYDDCNNWFGDSSTRFHPNDE